MIGKNQYHTRSVPKSTSMTVDDVVREYGMTDRQVRYRLKTGEFTRVPTTDPLVKMTRRSVERFFSQAKSEEE